MLLDTYKYYFENLDLFDPPLVSIDYFDKFRLLEKVTKV